MMVLSAIWDVLQSAIVLYMGVMLWIGTGALMLASIEFILKVFSLSVLKIKKMGTK